MDLMAALNKQGDELKGFKGRLETESLFVNYGTKVGLQMNAVSLACCLQS